MGSVLTYLAPHSVSIRSTLDGEWLNDYDTANIPCTEERRMEPAIDIALRGALSRYDARVAQHIRTTGRPRDTYRLSVWVTGDDEPLLDEWRPRVRAAWDRALKTREHCKDLATWKNADRSIQPTFGFFSGFALIFSFVLTSEVKKE